jgi:hypothetical protein
MNFKHLIAASTLALIGTSAFADAPERTQPFVSTMTRAQVQADLARAQASGELVRLRMLNSDSGSAPVMAGNMPRSVAEVRVEVMAAASIRMQDRGYAVY